MLGNYHHRTFNAKADKGLLKQASSSDDGPIFATVAKLVDALKRSIPEGTENAERKRAALRLAQELLRGAKYEED